MPLNVFAQSPIGLEPWLQLELDGLGLKTSGREPGGLSASWSWQQLERAHLESRIADRFLVRVGAGEAPSTGDIEAVVSSVRWAEWIPSGAAVELRAFASKGAPSSANRLRRAVAKALPSGVSHRLTTSARQAEQRITARWHGARLELSLDASGRRLHRRGWRTESGGAPLRETLAAALLAVGEMGEDEPVVDPFCGTGTIVIEAARKRLGLPASDQMDFAYRLWPIAESSAEPAVGAAPKHDAAPILAFDVDAEQVEASKRNAERAGVLDAIEFRVASATSSPYPSGGRGLIATNPPYGDRIGAKGGVRNLYQRTGEHWRRAAGGWRVCVALGTQRRGADFGLDLTRTAKTDHGGTDIGYWTGPVW